MYSNNMNMSEAGLDLLIDLEGCKQQAYKDVGGKLTIGVGHLITEEEYHSGLIHGYFSWSEGLTDEQCRGVLAIDLYKFEGVVNQAVNVPLTQNQFDALVCFAFNIGRHAFRSSTLVKVLNEGRYKEVPAQLRRWCKVKGKTVPGLKNRREKEIERWREPINLNDGPVLPHFEDEVDPFSFYV